jgi:hypothetical protein
MSARTSFEQLIEERTVVDDGLSQFFSAGLAASTTFQQRAGDSVIGDHIRVIHRHIFSTAIELLGRISPRRHHLCDEDVGLPNGAIRIVDEPRLQAPPVFNERLGLFGSEWFQLEAIDTVGAFHEASLGFRGGFRRTDRAIVFGSKALLQPSGPLSSEVSPGRDAAQDDHGGNDEDE